MIAVVGRLSSAAGRLPLVGLFVAISLGAARGFVWADLRSGMIDLRGLSRPARILIWLGFLLLALMIGALLFNDAWRASSPLLAALQGDPGRGKLVPVALLPATLFVLAVAWGFILAGALHAGPSIRLAILLLYLLTVAGWASSIFSLGVSGILGPDGPVVIAATVGVPAVFALRWRARTRPAFEFAVLFLLVLAAFAPVHARDVASWRTYGTDVMLTKLESHVLSYVLPIAPLLLLIGVDIANFVRRAAGWTAGVAGQHVPGRWLRLLLLVLLAWRLRDVGLELVARVERTSLAAETLAYAGALGEVLGIGLVWWLVARRHGPDADEVAEAGENHALPLILAFVAVQLAAFAVQLVGGAVPMIGGRPVIQVELIGLATRLDSQVTTYWRVALAGVALVGAIWLARRGRPALALYLGIFGFSYLWLEATGPGRPLAPLDRRGAEPVDFWWTALFALAALVWLVRGRLTAERAGQLLFLVIVAWLLRQTDFIENPFKPAFGLAGLGGITFIAFGILWDVLTKGGWANAGTPGLPRTSRILLYLGYVLITATVVNWYLTAHDLTNVGNLTGDFAFSGLDRFGKPILYAIFAVTLADAARERTLERPAA